jgi:DNA-binding NarL/FixJ family response regulator
VSIPVNITIVETSSIIIEGLSVILHGSGIPVHIVRAGNLSDLEKRIISHKTSIVIINPSLIQNNIRLFKTLKNDNPNIKWTAVLYAFHDTQLVSLFEGVINIFDPPEKIIAFMNKTILSVPKHEPIGTDEVLSERETEVLRLLAGGFANKVIADKLNISINTVISHRKNISQKTGIKSISGLTIYAVVKKLITLDNLT